MRRRMLEATLSSNCTFGGTLTLKEGLFQRCFLELGTSVQYQFVLVTVLSVNMSAIVTLFSITRSFWRQIIVTVTRIPL